MPDIKLENIMVKYIDSTHKKFIPKINDYGLSKQVKGGITSTICGTPIFMAPELILQKPYNSKADLWSIGVMIYIMIFKDIPYPITGDIFLQTEANVKNVFSGTFSLALLFFSNLEAKKIIFASISFFGAIVEIGL